MTNTRLPLPQLAEADLAAQARSTAGTLGQTLQSGVANAGTTFNRFVEGEPSSSSSHNKTRADPERKDFWDEFGAAPKGPAKDKQDFWDEFASAGEKNASQQQQQPKSKPSGIGTSAMKRNSAAPAQKKDDEQWGEW